MTGAPAKCTQTNRPPEVILQAPSSRVTVMAVSLAALVVVGAATANFLPSLEGISLPKLERVSLPKLDFAFLPNFGRIFSPPPPPKKVVMAPRPVPIPDFIARAALRDIQSSQQQNAASLTELTQNTAALHADLKRVSRQLSSLSAQVDGLHGAMSPLTTSSIPHSNPRTRITRSARRPPALPGPPPLPKPVGPVSVGGAPLSPAPDSGV